MNVRMLRSALACIALVALVASGVALVTAQDRIVINGAPA